MATSRGHVLLHERPLAVVTILVARGMLLDLHLPLERLGHMSTIFFHRLMGAATLDADTYEEVEADRSATFQALAVVVFSSLAAGIGIRGVNGTAAALAMFATTSVIALLIWAGWALVTFEIGSRLLPTADTRVDPGELLRTLGFAATPGFIQVFGALPGLRTPVLALAIVWALAASVIAVKQALDYTSTMRALAVCALGLFLSLTIAVVLGLAFGPTLSGLSQQLPAGRL
jgi:hypothetical protein